MNQAFESAAFLVRQTKADMERLKVNFTAWLSQGCYTPVVEVDAETGNKIYKARFSHLIPEEFRGIANNALNNIRHSFDQANSAVFKAVNAVEAPDNLYFPFVTCPNDLEGRLRHSNFANFPDAALNAIRGVEPYPTGQTHVGGNDLFSTFCGAAGRNKHRTTANLNGFIREFRNDMVRGTKIVRMALPPRWDIANSELIIGIAAHDGHIDYNFEITPEITFGDAGKLTGAPVYGATLTIVAIAEKLINELDASLPK